MAGPLDIDGKAKIVLSFYNKKYSQYKGYMTRFESLLTEEKLDILTVMATIITNNKIPCTDVTKFKLKYLCNVIKNYIDELTSNQYRCKNKEQIDALESMYEKVIALEKKQLMQDIVVIDKKLQYIVNAYKTKIQKCKAFLDRFIGLTKNEKWEIQRMCINYDLEVTMEEDAVDENNLVELLAKLDRYHERYSYFLDKKLSEQIPDNLSDSQYIDLIMDIGFRYIDETSS
jgi:hypothetical protein